MEDDLPAFFFDESSAVTVARILFRTNFQSKKNATLGVTGKSRCFFWKSKEIENQSCQFFIFFSKTPIF